VDGVHHALEDRIEETTCIIRITTRDKLRGSFDVCEKDRDLLSLVLDCVGSENSVE